MRNPSGTQQHLLEEIAFLKQRIEELEKTQELRTRAEEDLLRSEKLFHNLFDLTPFPCTLNDAEGRYVLVNDAFSRVSGCSAADAIGRTTEELGLSPTDKDSEALGAELTGKGELKSIETTFRNKAGEERRVIFSSRVIDFESSPLTLTVAVDVTERRQSESTLEESERKFRDLSEKSVAGIYLIQDGLFKYVNSRFADIFGYSTDELTDKVTVKDVVFPLDWPLVRDSLDKRMSGEVESLHYEFRIWTKNTEDIRDVEVFSSRTLYKGKPAVIGTLLDITDRKEAEREIIESKQLLDAILYSSPVGIGKVRNRTIVWANETLCRHSGYEREEMQGRDVSLFYENPGECERIGKLLYREGQCEARLVKKDGTNLDAFIQISPTDSYSYVFSVADVTQRKRMQEKLRQRERQLRDTAEKIPGMIFQFYGKPDGTVGLHYVSESARRTLDLDSETEGFYERFSERVAPECRESFESSVREAIRTGKPWSYEGKFIKDSGESIWFLTQSNPVPGEQEIMFNGVLLDITESKKAAYALKDSEEEKSRLQEQLRQSQKMEAIGTLAGGIAHDFNNILSVIAGYGSLAQMHMEDTNPLRKYIDEILSSSERAANLTRSLLAFSRKQPVALQPTSINNCVKEAEGMLKRLITEDIELAVSLSAEDIIVMADATQVDQILINLAANARDAMKAGGKLTIETKVLKRMGDARAVPGLNRPGKYVLLTVSDTGTGMDRSTREKIFDPFFTTKGPGKGTGLGLSTVYGIVKQHNGHIDVSSEPGKGTTFFVYLPFIEPEKEEKTAAPPVVEGGHETILLAEDDEAVRQLMKSCLGSYGYKVIEAVDGQDAIEAAGRHDGIDLMILDSVMPRKNGREAHDAIKAIRPQARTLFMSGYTKDVVLDRGVEDGEVDFIAKPIFPAVLLRKIREVMDKKEAPADS